MAQKQIGSGETRSIGKQKRSAVRKERMADVAAQGVAAFAGGAAAGVMLRKGVSPKIPAGLGVALIAGSLAHLGGKYKRVVRAGGFGLLAVAGGDFGANEIAPRLPELPSAAPAAQ